MYTRTGDKGETGLFGGARVSKSHLRVTAYGEIDELNSAIGHARSFFRDDPALAAVDQGLARIQADYAGLWCSSRQTRPRKRSW